jgi:biofilm protein TabA
MNNGLGRREFMFAPLFISAARVLWHWEYPTPRVHRLADWRSLKRLEELQPAFEFLGSWAAEDKTAGRYAVDGDRIYATIAEDKTRAPETAQFEAHRKYIDLHYLIRGKEMIGSAAAASLQTVKAYDPKTDGGLYQQPRDYQRLTLNPGDFTFFFPGQAHMPGCYVDKSEAIKKVVVKILAKTV